MNAHLQLAQIVGLLPYDRSTVAYLLGISLSTLQGYLRAASGAPIGPRAPGAVPPSPAVLAKARDALLAHRDRVEELLEELAPARPDGDEGEPLYPQPYTHARDG
jgi:hypothetical protein